VVSEKVHSLVDDDRVFDCFSGIAVPIKDTWWNVVATIGFRGIQMIMQLRWSRRKLDDVG